MDTYTPIKEILEIENLENFPPNTKGNHTLVSAMVYDEKILNKWKLMTTLMVEKMDVTCAFIFKFDLPKVEIVVSNPEKRNPFSDGDWFTLDQQTANLWTESLKNNHKLILPITEKEYNPHEKIEEVHLTSLPIMSINGKLMGMIGVILAKSPKEWGSLELKLAKFRDSVECDLFQVAA